MQSINNLKKVKTVFSSPFEYKHLEIKDASFVELEFGANLTGTVFIELKSTGTLDFIVNLAEKADILIHLLIVSDDLKIKINLNTVGIKSKLQFNLLTVTNNAQSVDVDLTATNRAKNSEIYTSGLAVATQQSYVRLNYIGQIENKMAKSKHFEKLKGFIKDNAKMELNPILEIKEFDVEAGHSAASGNINADTLFYLNSRGIDKNTAERIILNGFVEPFFNIIPDEKIQKKYLNELGDKLWTQ